MLVFKHRLIGLCLSFVLLLVLGLSGSGIALADSTTGAVTVSAGTLNGEPSFGLQPVLYDSSNPVTKSYFVFDTRPGTILYNRVRVVNNGTMAGTVSLYPVDATTGQTGGTVYLSNHDARRDVGAWLTLGTQRVTLAPGQSQIVRFQAAIPKTVRSGQHVGGIVAQSLTLKSSTKKGALQIYVRNLTIVAVQVNLPGIPIEQLVATGIQPGGANKYQTLLLGLRNTGTMMLKAHGSLQVFDHQAHLLQSQPLNLDTFLPQTAINYPVSIKKQALGRGDYRATLTLMYGHGHLVSYTTAFAITQHQLSQVFKSSPALLVPGLEGSPFGTLPLWLMVLAGLLLVSGLFYWGQTLYRLASCSLHRRTYPGTTASSHTRHPSPLCSPPAHDGTRRRSRSTGPALRTRQTPVRSVSARHHNALEPSTTNLSATLPIRKIAHLREKK